MNILKRLTSISIISILVIGFMGYGDEAPAGGLHKKVADAYGFHSFGKVEQIRFTFNVQIGDRNVVRSWIWHPKTHGVTFLGDGKKETSVSYNRNDLTTNPAEKLKKIDARFINDQYWLLFPLHLVWDDKAKIENTGPQKLPMGEGTGYRLVVTYPPTGGYTPGDSYELFIDKDNRISHWVFHRGGSPKPTRTTTWEDHRYFGPLTISLNHRGSDDKFRLWFTGVAVKLTGSDQWVEAE